MRKRIQPRGMAIAVVVGVLATGLSACEPASGPSPAGSEDASSQSTPSDQEVPKKKPSSQPKRDATTRPAATSKTASVPMPALPQLSGNAEKDKAAVMTALAQLKTQWTTNQQLLVAAQSDKAKKRRVKPEYIKQLGANNKAFAKRAEEIQALLTKLKQKN